MTLAVDRAKTGELGTPDADNKVKSDRRHLYLAREGLLHAESEVGVPAGDLAKRERADGDTNTKLKNPLLFVSPVRLSVRNLLRGDPGSGEPEVKEGELKKHLLAAAIRGLREGLVDRVDGDQSLFPAGRPDRNNMASPAIKTVRIMREDSAPVVVAEERERAEGEASKDDDDDDDEERDEGDSDDSDVLGGVPRVVDVELYVRSLLGVEPEPPPAARGRPRRRPARRQRIENSQTCRVGRRRYALLIPCTLCARSLERRSAARARRSLAAHFARRLSSRYVR